MTEITNVTGTAFVVAEYRERRTARPSRSIATTS